MPHFLETLRLLRERLERDDDQAKLSDATAAIIMGLAGLALLSGDSKSAQHHVVGLHKLVGLRGSVSAFTHNAKLLMEILKYELPLIMHFYEAKKFLTITGAI